MVALDLTTLGEQLANKHDEIQAATDFALKNGGLTDENKARIDTLRDEAAKLQKDYDWAAGLQKEMGDRTKQLDTPRDSVPLTRDSGPRITVKDNEDPRRGFKNLNDMLYAVHRAGSRGGVDNRLKSLAVQNAAGGDEQSGISDPYGGFLIPEILLPRMLQLGFEGDPTAGRVQPIPMGGPTVKIPARTDKNHTNSVSGGFRVYRRPETQAGTSSRIEMERVVLDAVSQFGLAYATEEILSDSPQSIMAIIERGAQEEFPSEQFKEKINGTGAGEPEGILNCPATISIASRAGAGTIAGADILAVRQRVWRYDRAIWLANHDCYTALASAFISGANGDRFLFAPGTTLPGTGPDNNASVDVPDTLLGRPIFFTEYAKTLGSPGDLICGVWSEYLWGTLQAGPQMAESIHVRFEEHERTFKFFLRNDGRCWWRSELTPVESAQTLSPFVIIPT